MKKINVCLSGRPYSIVIGRDLLARAGRLMRPLKAGKKILIVTNRKVARHYLKPLSSALVKAGYDVSSHRLPYGDERDKSAAVLAVLWRRMAGVPLERSSALVALGGGVVGDLAGFAAATYMRGITLVQVPTTLLGQVDSAIGGKTAIDLPEAKNGVGAFYQPRLVISDIGVLRTLDLKDVRSQLAEVIKYGVIADPKLFALLEEQSASFFSAWAAGIMGPREFRFLETIVSRSAAIKAGVVEQDERETKGRRIILNYGHTFAHALEGASGFRMRHGDAVAVGMVMAGALSRGRKMFSRADELRQRELIRQSGLPVSVNSKRFSVQSILPFMKRDKKVRHGRMRFVLPRSIGRVVVVDDVSEKEVVRVFKGCRW